MLGYVVEGHTAGKRWRQNLNLHLGSPEATLLTRMAHSLFLWGILRGSVRCQVSKMEEDHCSMRIASLGAWDLPFPLPPPPLQLQYPGRLWPNLKSSNHPLEWAWSSSQGPRLSWRLRRPWACTQIYRLIVGHPKFLWGREDGERKPGEQRPITPTWV